MSSGAHGSNNTITDQLLRQGGGGVLEGAASTTTLNRPPPASQQQCCASGAPMAHTTLDERRNSNPPASVSSLRPAVPAPSTTRQAPIVTSNVFGPSESRLGICYGCSGSPSFGGKVEPSPNAREYGSAVLNIEHSPTNPSYSPSFPIAGCIWNSHAITVSGLHHFRTVGRHARTALVAPSKIPPPAESSTQSSLHHPEGSPHG